MIPRLCSDYISPDAHTAVVEATIRFSATQRLLKFADQIFRCPKSNGHAD